jgi:hypothetical protein
MQTWKLTELKVKDGARRQPKLCNRRLEKKQAPSSYSPTHTMNFWADKSSDLSSEVFQVIGPASTFRSSICIGGGAARPSVSCAFANARPTLSFLLYIIFLYIIIYVKKLVKISMLRTSPLPPSDTTVGYQPATSTVGYHRRIPASYFHRRIPPSDTVSIFFHRLSYGIRP